MIASDSKEIPMRKHAAPLMLMALAGILAASGCGKEQTDTGATTTAATPKTAPGNAATPAPAPTAAHALTTEELDGVTSAKDKYKIVLIVKTRNNPFFKPMIEAFTKTAEELGVQGEVQSAAQETDAQQQSDLVQTEVNNGVKAILITPADSKGLVPALKAAQDKGVLIVNLDNRLDPETVKAQGLELGGYIGANNEDGGKLAGEEMIAALGGKGKVAILEGIRGVDNAEARKRGFLGAVTTNLDIVATETANWKTEEAYAKTQNILKTHADLNGIFCANDNMAIGALKAVAEAGKKGQIKVIGYDNIPDVKVALDSGDMTATIEQHPDLMGRYGLKLAVGILNGDVSKGGDLLVHLEVIKNP
jgi:ribose transport system substrate-binding protein